MEWMVGVDSHKVTFSAGAVDELGRVVEAKEFQNEKEGHVLFLEWARSKGQVLRIGPKNAKRDADCKWPRDSTRDDQA